MQREINCGECGMLFTAFSGRARYCGACRDNRRKRWRQEHPEAAKAIASANYYRHKDARKRAPGGNGKRTGAAPSFIYCPACDRKTSHITVVAAAHCVPAKLQCSACTRVRTISAAELKEVAS